jgi:hypothetical protein
MHQRLKYFFFLIFILVVADCKKPYAPPIIVAANNYLVVEGTINSGTDSTFIHLSLTTNLSSKVTVGPVLHAVVTVESDQNNSYQLKEKKNGYYVSAGLNLDNAKKYRLRMIITTVVSSKQYLSDFVPVVNTPPIDSVNFAVAENGVGIYANTHNPKNNTRYYRWDYKETWIFHSAFHSLYKSDGHGIFLRDLLADDIYKCWQSDTSSTIILGSSAKLVSDIIINNPVTFIASSSEKLGTEYSIMVRQYALTGDAYKFWQNLKKNTEQLGGIFDAQPSQISGNIHCVTEPSEPVVGYVSAGTYTTTRIFIRNPQLPRWNTENNYVQCQADTFLYRYTPPGTRDTINQVTPAFNYLNGNNHPKYPLIPINELGLPGQIVPYGYTGSSRECVDCTVRGTNKQPAFWKY